VQHRDLGRLACDRSRAACAPRRRRPARPIDPAALEVVVSDAAEPDPWDRRPDETARAYEAFRTYRDLGPARRPADVAGYADGTKRRWRAIHAWDQRAAAWDAETYRLEDTRRLEQIRQMDDTHQRAARAMITAGLRAIAEQPKLTPHQAARFVDLGARLERAALLGDHLAPPPLAPVVDDEELSPLERIARELAGTA
jgi:hypothetical protein